MSRFLFVVPPLVGHVNPVVGVAAELSAHGHQVAWAGHPELLARLVGPGARIFPTDTPDRLLERGPDLKGPAALKFLWESVFLPLAETMAPGVQAAIDGFAPDVVVADQQAIAGGLLAEKAGLRWVTSATTSAELISPLSSMPKVAAWVEELLDGVRERIGIPAGLADPRFSPHGVLAFTTRELIGDAEFPHDRVWLVGPAVNARPTTADFPWEWLDPARKHVLVTLGTANLDAGGRFLGEAAKALAGMRDTVQAIILDPAGTLGECADNLLVREHVPQLDLLPRLDAVVCHGGHNTVCESLWHGVPLIVAPIRDDQPIVAGQVADAGAGIRARFGRSTAVHIAAALDAVLAQESPYRAAARAIGESFRAAGGATTAAGRLADLAAAGR